MFGVEALVESSSLYCCTWCRLYGLRKNYVLKDLKNVAGEVKVVVVGNGSVGKTSMIRQFAKGQYCNEYKKTIGVDFLEKHQ